MFSVPVLRAQSEHELYSQYGELVHARLFVKQFAALPECDVDHRLYKENFIDLTELIRLMCQA